MMSVSVSVLVHVMQPPTQDCILCLQQNTMYSSIREKAAGDRETMA